MWKDPEAVATLYLVSLKDDADKLRGGGAGTIIIDEARDVVNLDYIMADVLGWMFVDKEAPLMVISSTPPKVPHHPFKQIVSRAIQEDRYLIVRADENNDFSQRDEKMVLKFCGGRETTAWQREALCEFVTDEDSLIVPEFARNKEQIVKEWPRPKYFFPWIFVDSGFSIDYTAILYAYVDWETQKLVIVDENLLRKANLGDIANCMREGEERNFSKAFHQTRRIGDFKPREIDDLRKHFGTMIRPAEKWDRESAISYMRTSFGTSVDRIRIDPKCKSLIYQLEFGTRDEKGEFIRNELLGHCDLVAALIYGHRMVNFNSRPIPDYSKESFNTIYSPPPEESQEKTLQITHRPLHITMQPIKNIGMRRL